MVAAQAAASAMPTIAQDQRVERRPPRARQQRADDRREGDERDHLRLRELEVVAPGRDRYRSGQVVGWGSQGAAILSSIGEKPPAAP